MPLPQIAGVVRATFRGVNVAGQQWANVLHFQYAAGASTPGPTEIAALDVKALRLYAGTGYTTGQAWFGNVPSTTKLIDATYYVLNGTSVPVIIPHTDAGSLATTTNPAQEVAHVLTLRTANRGRRYRGRVYLPGLSTAAMAGATGTVTPSIVTNFLTQANGLLTDLGSIQWAWGVASYGRGTFNGQPTTWTPFFTPIASFYMDAVPDVQRRRKQ